MMHRKNFVNTITECLLQGCPVATLGSGYGKPVGLWSLARFARPKSETCAVPGMGTQTGSSNQLLQDGRSLCSLLSAFGVCETNSAGPLEDMLIDRLALVLLLVPTVWKK